MASNHTSELAKSIAEVLAEFDLMGLREGNPDIVDEYRAEAEDISRRLLEAARRQESVSVVEIRAVSASVFETWFGEGFVAEAFESPAKKIQDLMSK